MLVDRRGARRRASAAGKLGGAVFRKVKPGRGYRVRVAATTRVRVLSDPPGAAVDQASTTSSIPQSGYGYLTTRDGTQLAINVHLPGRRRARTRRSSSTRATATRDPDGGESSIAQIANLLGYAVVDVNMRGTGCSGGAFDYFEPLQGLDGYDVVETVARQPWVAHGKVGMVGISYGGISQLFVAATRPPSLAAITPLSVIDNTADDAVPGRDPQHRLRARRGRRTASTTRKPASRDRRPGVGARAHPRRRPDLQGQPGAARRGGRPARKMRAQQLLRPEGRRPALAADVRAQDHVAGVPRLPVDRRADRRPLPDARRRASPARRASGSRSRTARTSTRSTRRRSSAGTTSSSCTSRAARRSSRRRSARARAGDLPGGDGRRRRDAARRPDPGRSRPTPRRGRPSRRCRRCGSCSTTAPAAPRRARPSPAFERSFSRFPLPGTRARSWYLGAGRRARRPAPPAPGADQFTWNRTARPPTNFTGNTGAGANGLWTATPPYRWPPQPGGHRAVLRHRAARRGHRGDRRRRAEAWIRSSRAAASTSRPRSPRSGPTARRRSCRAAGCARAARKLDARKSTLLEPVPSLRRADAAPLPRGPLGEGDGPALLPGPRLPGRVAAPRHARRAARRPARVGVRRARSRAAAPRVVALARARAAVAAGPAGRPRLDAPTPLPPCPGLRGQPCRPYEG